MDTQTAAPEAKDRSWAGMSAAHYERQVGRVARDLRTLAEKVEQEGSARPGVTGTKDEHPEYVAAAGRIIHAITSGLANASLEGLVSAASEADRAARHPEASL